MDKISFNKENPTELFSQLVKILQRDGNSPEIPQLIQEAKKLSSKVQDALKKGKSQTYEAVKSAVRKRLSKLK